MRSKVGANEALTLFYNIALRTGRQTESKSVSTILTIGYEGATIEDFIATMKSTGVEVLIDIRDVPVSRKRGFSKRALAEFLENAGIRYVHLRHLGDPKAGREAARRGDMGAFRRIFRAHLAGREAQLALDQALAITSEARACLLCFERDHTGCHRALVAKEMSKRESVQVLHIGVKHGLAEETDYADFEDGRAYAFG